MCNFTFLPALQGPSELMCTKHVEEEPARNPSVQAVRANVISSVEQTNFAGALRRRPSNILSVHFNLISCAYLVFPGHGQYLQARKGFCGQQRH